MKCSYGYVDKLMMDGESRRCAEVHAELTDFDEDRKGQREE